ncbi:MAG: hypothetical protein C0401_09130 [Anaerolinea sp.]|nr:hypothetical protein [Anaerolinea sp.]
MRKIGLIVIGTVFLLTGCDRSNGTAIVNPAEGMQVATLSGNSPHTTPIPTKDLGPFILLQDDFSDPASGWEIFDGDFGRSVYDRGGYLVEAQKDETTMWGTAGKNFDNIRIDVDVRMLTAPANGNNAFGVDCRIQPNGDGYSFHISSDGWFAIIKFENEGSTQLYKWEQSSAILQGNEINHITAVCQGNHLTFMVNDVQLAEVTDETYSQGDISLSATTYETEPTSVMFDDIIVLQLGNPYEYEDRESYSLSIINPTRSQVCYVYIVPSSEEYWGFDLLGEGSTINPGETMTFDDLTSSEVDVKVETCQNVRLIEKYKINLAETSSILLIEPQLLNREEFTDTQGWTSGVVDGGTISYINGDYYSISVTAGDKLVTGTGNFKAEDTIIVTDASLVKTGADSKGIYGITCRMQPDNSGIFFAVRGDGSASIRKIVKGTLVFLTEWKYSDYIYPGINANYIEGDCIGTTYTMYVNGDYIASVEDSDFSNGYVGTAVFSPPGPTTQADFDFVDVYLGH